VCISVKLIAVAVVATAYVSTLAIALVVDFVLRSSSNRMAIDA
jgi:hypothetical protein